jgi:PAS domain S-box-containing protein
MTKPSIKPYALAIVSVGLATLASWLLHPFLTQEAFMLFLAAVIIVAMYGNMRAALVTILLSVFLQDLLFDGTPFRFDLYLADFERAIIFALAAVIVTRLASTRNLMLERLSKKNAELQAIFDHIPVMLAFIGKDGRLKLVNREWEHTLGWSLEEIQSRDLDILAMCYPDPEYRRYVLDFISTARARWADFKTKTRDGQTIDTSWTNVKLSDGTSIGLGQDITARKQADEKLREYEKVVEGLDEMIVVVDREYRYLIANRAFLNYRDLKREQVMGHLVSEFLDPASFEMVRQKLDECFQGRVVRYELRFPYPNIGERDLFLSYFPIEGAGGVDRAACILRDITEQRRAEKALRKAEKKYRDIFENAGEGIFQTTPEGQYIEANPALARMHGFDFPEDLIRNLKDISHQVYVDPSRREEFKDLLETQGFVRGFEHQLLRRDGSKIWVSINARAVRDEQGKILYYEGTTQDINERKLAEARSAAFATLARKLSGATTPLQTGRIIAETASELFGWDACNLDLYDADYDLLHPILIVDTIAGRRSDITASCVDRKPTARGRRIIDHGPELLLREDPIRFDQDAIPFGDTMRPSASIMTVPIRHASRIVGMLSIQSYAPHAYDAAALSDLQSLAEHCGEALNRIHAEQSFYESEERFRQMAEHFEDVVWLTDKEICKVVYVNPAYEKVFRHTCESLYDRLESFLDAVHPEDRVRVERMVESQKEGDHAPIEYRIAWPDGSVRWILQRSFPMRNTEGEVNLVAGIAQDITDRKRADEALRESEERYRDLVENSREFICTHDLNGLVLSANRAAVEVLGYDPKEFEGRKSFRDLLVPEVRDQFDDYLARIRRNGFANGITLVQTRTGERRLLEYHNTLRTEGVVTPIVRGMANDITERKRAEDALRESERFRRTIVESEPECVKLVAPDYTVLDMNPAGLAMIGAGSREQVVGLSMLSIIAPEWRETFMAMHERVCRGDSVVAEFEVVGLTGVRRWMETHAAPLRNKDAKVIGQLAITLDITDRKRADESLKLFRNLIDQSSDAIEVIDPITFRFVDCNESAHRSLGYSREEFLSLTIFDIDPLATPSSIARSSEEMKESGSATFESVHCRKDGATFPVEINVKLVELEKSYRLAVVRDITGRKRVQEALRASEERYRELFENANDAIYVHDLSGRYVSLNRAAEKLSGYSRDEIIGKHFSNFVAPKDLKHVRKNLCKKLDVEGETTYEIDLVTKDRRRVPVEVVSRLIYENGQPVGVQGTARDMTERKRAQEALQIYSRRLIEAQEAERQNLARELHDEIGQVLTAVRINLQTVQNAFPTEACLPRVEESIVIVDEALARIGELSLELRPSLLDDLGLAAALRWYVDRYGQRTGIVAEVLNGFEERGRLPRDLETECFRIAQEALTNVARHAQATRVSVQVEGDQEKLVLTITDNGTGFDTDNLLTTASSASTLGLRGMKERALAMNGHIEIESSPGKGTHIRASFPLKRRN